jgi:hypothetical protein
MEAGWNKSSFCATSTCVQVGLTTTGCVMVTGTDSSEVLLFDEDEWIAFIKGVKNGEFDL